MLRNGCCCRCRNNTLIHSSRLVSVSPLHRVQLKNFVRSAWCHNVTAFNGIDSFLFISHLLLIGTQRLRTYVVLESLQMTVCCTGTSKPNQMAQSNGTNSNSMEINWIHWMLETPQGGFNHTTSALHKTFMVLNVRVKRTTENDYEMRDAKILVVNNEVTEINKIIFRVTPCAAQPTEIYIISIRFVRIHHQRHRHGIEIIMFVLRAASGELRHSLTETCAQAQTEISIFNKWQWFCY